MAAAPLALDERAHYSDSIVFNASLMGGHGHSEKWKISDLDLAVLFDLGLVYKVIGTEPIALKSDLMTASLNRLAARANSEEPAVQTLLCLTD